MATKRTTPAMRKALDAAVDGTVTGHSRTIAALVAAGLITATSDTTGQLVDQAPDAEAPAADDERVELVAADVDAVDEAPAGPLPEADDQAQAADEHDLLERLAIVVGPYDLALAREHGVAAAVTRINSTAVGHVGGGERVQVAGGKVLYRLDDHGEGAMPLRKVVAWAVEHGPTEDAPATAAADEPVTSDEEAEAVMLANADADAAAQAALEEAAPAAAVAEAPAPAPVAQASSWPADKPALQWSEPPVAGRSQRRNPVDFPRVAAELRAADGRWAEILEAAEKPTTAAHVANRIRHARVEAFAPAGAFEARAVGNRVWARYVGA